jgi:hypothetical protein
MRLDHAASTPLCDADVQPSARRSRTTDTMKTVLYLAVGLTILLGGQPRCVADQSAQAQLEKIVGKLSKLSCLCTKTSAPEVNGRIGSVAPTHNVSGTDTTVGLICFVPLFDESGAIDTHLICDEFQVLPR